MVETKRGWVERRQFERVVATLEVDYRFLNAEDSEKILHQKDYQQTAADRFPELSSKTPFYHAVTRDIGLGGLALLGEQPFEVGKLIEVSLRMTQSGRVIKLLAQIIHSEPSTESGRVVHRAGMKTLAIYQEDLNRIEEYLIKQKNKPE